MPDPVGKIEVFSGRATLVGHIADWLKAAVANKAPWLSKLDEKGRPKKLLKFGTLEAIAAGADKAMRRHNQNARRSELAVDAEIAYMELADGYRLVRLMSTEALDAESLEMQHCIGHGGYDDKLADPSVVFLSLRDATNKAHATLEIENGIIRQLSGKQNAYPDPKYLRLLHPLLSRPDIDLMDMGDGSHGVVIDGNVWNTGALPEIPQSLCARANDDVFIASDIADSSDDFFPTPIQATRAMLHIGSTPLQMMEK
jgi:hypothetical protein